MSAPPSGPVRYLVVEGVIGVGKTSLVHRFHRDWGGRRFLEIVEDNPFLTGGFYRDMEGHAFDTEMFFLLSRFRQQRTIERALTGGDERILADYLFAKNRIFAGLTLSGDDARIWERLYRALEPETPPPDLVVYLEASTDVLLDRIRTRGRPFERDLTREYLERVNRAYDAFFDSFSHRRLLTIDVSGLDFVRSDADYAAVAARIRHKMATIASGQGDLGLLEEAGRA